MSSHLVAQAQKRRSTRIEQAVPLVVQGVGAMREPYQEQVSTISISCHGCTYQSRHEVIQGETVFLDIKPPSNGSTGYSGRARVKWSQKSPVKERAFQIAVELEVFGNVWGVAAPPKDWFPLRIPEATEPAAGRELKVVTRKESQEIAAPEAAPDRITRVEKKEAAASSIPLFEKLMVGFGEHIQTMATDAAAAALITEKDRLLEDVRGQLQSEAVKAIQTVIAASKDVISRQALKEFHEAHEASARQSYAQWVKKIEQDMENARQHLVVQVKEVNRRTEAMAAAVVERVQQNMEVSRKEAVERFVARLREQVAPMIAETRDSIQKLEVSEAAFKRDSETIYKSLENQLAFTADACLSKTHEEIEKSAAANAAKANESVSKLYQSFESAARKNVEALLTSAGAQMNRILQERAAEVSRQFSAGIEGYTKDYLQTIGNSIAEIPNSVPGRVPGAAREIAEAAKK